MSERYKVIDSSIPNFITITVVDWVDLFIRPSYFRIIDDSLSYCIENKGLVVHAYVYMSSHLHSIVSSKGEELQNIIRDFKKFTSRELLKAINESSESRREWLLNKFSYAADRIKRGVNYKIWKNGFHPILLDTNVKLEQRLHYLHENPVSAELVYHERDWVNSSYSVYEEANKETLNVKVEPLW
jgi:REP element-mobilizing transposase RayT